MDICVYVALKGVSDEALEHQLILDQLHFRIIVGHAVPMAFNLDGGLGRGFVVLGRLRFRHPGAELVHQAVGDGPALEGEAVLRRGGFIFRLELRQFNEHLDDLPRDIARMLFTIENVGMRVSELCTLTIDCLNKDIGGEYVLTYYQFKSKKTNRVPISKELAQSCTLCTSWTQPSFALPLFLPEDSR